MRAFKRSIIITFCVALLCSAAAAGTFTYNVSLPTGAFTLLSRQMAELSAFAGLDISLIAVDTIDVPARERAQERWDDAGTALWGVGAEVSDAAVVIVYDVAHNAAGVVRSEGAKALLTDADVDAVEAAFAAPDGASSRSGSRPEGRPPAGPRRRGAAEKAVSFCGTAKRSPPFPLSFC